jgi:hypothetical protein
VLVMPNRSRTRNRTIAQRSLALPGTDLPRQQNPRIPNAGDGLWLAAMMLRAALDAPYSQQP